MALIALGNWRNKERLLLEICLDFKPVQPEHISKQKCDLKLGIPVDKPNWKSFKIFSF